MESTISRIADFLCTKKSEQEQRIAEFNSLRIPYYQRPYRWSMQNVKELLSDLKYQRIVLQHELTKIPDEDSVYPLGTIVLHEIIDGCYDIVDGQQRTITLLLLLKAAQETERPELKSVLAKYKLKDICLPECSETHANLLYNYRQIQQLVSRPDFTENVLDFLLHQCQVVVVSLKVLSEAFQFFDSQNARGLDLSPHDLLKAFHLRDFEALQNKDLTAVKKQVVNSWEMYSTSELRKIFSGYFYPILQWTKGRSGVGFNKDDIELFKGLSLSGKPYPYQRGAQLINQAVAGYNSSIQRDLDDLQLSYPHQLTGVMINGQHFFDWVAHYQPLVSQLTNDSLEQSEHWLYLALARNQAENTYAKEQRSRPSAIKILQVLDGKGEISVSKADSDTRDESQKWNYDGRYRTGDKYVRRLFNALVLAYFDRFGEIELDNAIELAFIWTYSLRLKQSAVYLASLEKYLREELNLFRLLNEALIPADFINISLPLVEPVKSTKTEGIESLFNALGYRASKP